MLNPPTPPPPPLVGIGYNHSKSQKTGYEDITEVVAVVLVALCSGNQKKQK